MEVIWAHHRQTRLRRVVISQILTNNNFIVSHLMNEEEINQPLRRWSIHGHWVINRGHEEAHLRLWIDYFRENPLYDDTMFRRRFRIGRSSFLRIIHDIQKHDNYFQQRYDTLGRSWLSNLQKITAVFRMLVDGTSTNSTDKYIKIGESTAIECMKRFCRDMVKVLSERYLRSANENDIARLLHIGEQRGFPGMLGSFDCMHWEWKNCPRHEQDNTLVVVDIPQLF